jgi:SAM-dependent methyltransferase
VIAVAEQSWRERFAEVFGAPDSPSMTRAWAAAFGEEYPAEVQPYSYVSVTELRRFAEELAGARVLLDLGCGRGGPGLWTAARIGARLEGVDIAETAVARARARAAALGVPAEYRVGTFAETGLPAGGADAAMSVDALLFAPDKAAAAAEFARVLAPGGRLVLTTWDYHSQPVGRPPQVPDHRPVLAEAGFDVLAYEETEDWRARQDLVADLMLADVEAIAAETGADPEGMRAGLLEMRATHDRMSRRVLVVARRR